MRRWATAAIAMAALLAAPLAATAAPTYPAPSSDSLNLSATTVAPDGTVDFAGSGFEPGETVEVTATLEDADDETAPGLRGSAGAAFTASGSPIVTTVIASSEGNVLASINLADAGLWTIIARGLTSGHIQSAAVTVGEVATAVGGEKAASADGTDLSYTGTNRTLLVLGSAGGVLALIIGAGLIWLAATRRPVRRA